MRIKMFAAAVSLTLLGTASFAQSVSFDLDRSVNFSRFRTYAWTPGTELADQLHHARVVRSIEGQLAGRRLTKVQPDADPDVLVAYHTSFDRNLQINAFGSGWGGPRFGALRSGTATTQEILTGTLVVDIIDARTRALAWRGMASGDINTTATPEQRDRNINRAVQKMFKNYPAKP
jgi:hypothetical protein